MIALACAIFASLVVGFFWHEDRARLAARLRATEEKAELAERMGVLANETADAALNVLGLVMRGKQPNENVVPIKRGAR